MRSAIACLLLFSPSPTVWAAFTDFSDYTQRTAFATGQTFQSMGLSFRATDFLTISNEVAISANPSTGYARMYVGPGVEFLLPPGAQEVSFDYQDGARVRLAVNGVQPAAYPGQGGLPGHAGFSFLHGASLGGVEVTTVTEYSAPDGEKGVLTLRGPIDSLVIAGLELLIDNVAITVPEPSAAALLLSGLLAMPRVRQLVR